MLTKRTAIIAIFTGALAKMTHADEPTNPSPMTPHMRTWVHELNKPRSWFINLDQMKNLEVSLGGKTVTVSAAEIFAALGGS